MNKYFYFKEYLPTRYDENAEQERDRKTCYAFKDGVLNDNVKDFFVNKVKEITNNSTEGWAICFIPASTDYKTKLRFSKLAEVLKKEGYDVAQDAIYNEYDKESEHLNGKSNNPIASFGFDGTKLRNKKIILIDDIITRGKTFNMTAEKLEALGASSVIGLFLAKTISPCDYFLEPEIDDYDYDYDPEPEATYEEYRGSWAQDIEGWSDQDIDDVLDGNPDAYWNLD